ncbi:nucleotide sugar dehydrogenase [Streptomyces sp. NPDC088785]|uniref:nucleotide sugar dehydrogenase n=1 Tax=Streptomyces sp. NPDC088785 TaxID=3365897 RepID=UPI0037FD5A82
MTTLSSVMPLTRRTKVCVQGVGFAGAAMAIGLAEARDSRGQPVYDVYGIERDSPRTQKFVDALNSGRFPHRSDDPDLERATRRAHDADNLHAATDPAHYRDAEVVVISVNLDVAPLTIDGEPQLQPLRDAVTTLGATIPPDCLVLVECTVPPGTCRDLVVPLLAEGFARRGFTDVHPCVAHTYERVTPGPGYLASVTDQPRVYAADDTHAAERARRILTPLVADPARLRALPSTIASETAKLLENTFRAVTIALMDEWSAQAETNGVDLFQVVDAIRERPTHRNLRDPGLGVGGYCLTKDPVLATAGLPPEARRAAMPITSGAVAVNRAMPLRAVERLVTHYGPLPGARVLLLGVTYRDGVGDTRHSPSAVVHDELRARGAHVVCHDPLADDWPGVDAELRRDLPCADSFDIVVLCVAHTAYRALDLPQWLNGATPLVYDTNHVLTPRQIAYLAGLDLPLLAVGRGDL